jgi:predicted nucleotidyltransferase
MVGAFTHEALERLRGLDVVAIYLFGSRSQGVEHPLADYDYAVLTRGREHKRGGELYMQLYEILAEVSPRTLEQDVIDIVFLANAPLELRFHVIRYGKVLYDADPRERLEFEALTGLLYADYRPILDQMDESVLDPK